ncbi:hypothetical protein Godav_025799, partial [Gossypium davidsonii]|nr:hypothetical protein [Gossypium davidsonii]
MNKTNDSQGLITSSLSRGTRRLQLLPQCRLRWMRISLLPLPPDMAACQYWESSRHTRTCSC